MCGANDLTITKIQIYNDLYPFFNLHPQKVLCLPNKQMDESQTIRSSLRNLHAYKNTRCKKGYFFVYSYACSCHTQNLVLVIKYDINMFTHFLLQKTFLNC